MWYSVDEKIPNLNRQPDNSFISRVVPIMVDGLPGWKNGYLLKRNNNCEWVVIDHWGDWKVLKWFDLPICRIDLKELKNE